MQRSLFTDSQPYDYAVPLREEHKPATGNCCGGANKLHLGPIRGNGGG